MSSDSPGSATEHWTRGSAVSFKKSFNVAAGEFLNSSHAICGKITGCPVRPPNSGWQIVSGFCAENSSNCRKVSERECGWSPRTIAQLEISFRQPVQFAAQTMELNIPHSGCGFSMRSDFG